MKKEEIEQEKKIKGHPISYFSKISPKDGCYFKAKYAVKDPLVKTILYELITKKEYQELTDNAAALVEIIHC